MSFTINIPVNETVVARNERLKNQELGEHLQLLKCMKIAFLAQKRVNDDGSSTLDMDRLNAHITRRDQLLATPLANMTPAELADFSTMKQSITQTGISGTYDHDRFRPVLTERAKSGQGGERRIIFSGAAASGDFTFVTPDKTISVVVRELILSDTNYNVEIYGYIVGVDNSVEMARLGNGGEIIKSPVGTNVPEVSAITEQWYDADQNVAPSYVNNNMNTPITEYVYFVPQKSIQLSQLYSLIESHGGLDVAVVANTIEQVAGDTMGSQLWSSYYYSYAHTGAGSVFNKSDVLFHLKSDTMVTTDASSNVSSWTDLVSGSTSFSQSVQLNQPSQVTDNRGQPAVLFRLDIKKQFLNNGVGVESLTDKTLIYITRGYEGYTPPYSNNKYNSMEFFSEGTAYPTGIGAALLPNDNYWFGVVTSTDRCSSGGLVTPIPRSGLYPSVYTNVFRSSINSSNGSFITTSTLPSQPTNATRTYGTTTTGTGPRNLHILGTSLRSGGIYYRPFYMYEVLVINKPTLTPTELTNLNAYIVSTYGQ